MLANSREELSRAAGSTQILDSETITGEYVPIGTTLGEAATTASVGNQGLVVGQGPQGSDALEFVRGVVGPGDFSGDILLSGDFSSGDDPATVSMENKVTFASASSLIVKLGGFAKGSEHDSLAVGDTATLDGMLDVRQIESFQSFPGDTFVILNRQHAGPFESVEHNSPFPSLWHVVDYDDAQAVVLRAAALPGDANLYGRVDVMDLNVVGLNWLSQVGSWRDGDFNADGRANVRDLNVLGLNWLRDISEEATAAPIGARVPRAPLANHAVADIAGVDRISTSFAATSAPKLSLGDMNVESETEYISSSRFAKRHVRRALGSSSTRINYRAPDLHHFQEMSEERLVDLVLRKW